MVQLINFIMAISSYVKFMILFVLDSWHFMKWTSVSNVGFDNLLSGSDIGTFNSFQKNNFVLGTKTGASVKFVCPCWETGMARRAVLFSHLLRNLCFDFILALNCWILFSCRKNISAQVKDTHPSK